MSPHLNLFGQEVSAYLFMAILGILATVIYVALTNRGGKVGRIPASGIFLAACFIFAGVLVGAKALGIIVMVTQTPDILASGLSFFDLIAGAPIVFYGGAMGAALGAYLYCRVNAVPYGMAIGLFVPAVPLFHMFGRIGCFLGGCCYGVPYEHGIAFTHSLAAPNGIPLLPVQLIEAGFNALLFVALAVLSRRMAAPWKALPLYVLCYSVMRFALEFFRGDANRGVFILSTSQWISLALFVGVALFFVLRRQKRAATPGI